MIEECMDRYTYFWCLIIIAMGIFFIGSYKNIIKKIAYVLWLNKTYEDTTSAKTASTVGFPGSKTILNEAILQIRIQQRSLFLWVRHLLIFLGFVLLFLIDGFFAVTTRYYPVEYFHTGIGRGFLKFGFEATGIILLTGLTLGLVHRVIFAREEKSYIDIKLLLLLWTVVVTGFLTESFRFVIEPNDLYLRFSFIAGPVAGQLRSLSWPWREFHTLIWVFHATVTAFFFAYLPFSKFVHVFVTPVGRSVTMAEGFVKQKRGKISEGLL
jgi:nitrate reductase gamma subunit